MVVFIGQRKNTATAGTCEERSRHGKVVKREVTMRQHYHMMAMNVVVIVIIYGEEADLCDGDNCTRILYK